MPEIDWRWRVDSQVVGISARLMQLRPITSTCLIFVRINGCLKLKNISPRPLTLPCQGISSLYTYSQGNCEVPCKQTPYPRGNCEVPCRQTPSTMRTNTYRMLLGNWRDYPGASWTITHSWLIMFIKFCPLETIKICCDVPFRADKTSCPTDREQTQTDGSMVNLQSKFQKTRSCFRGSEVIGLHYCTCCVLLFSSLWNFVWLCIKGWNSMLMW